jgi:hypothetical protein
MTVYNRAAFARENVEDARRGHPDFDLHNYAAEPRLEFIDHAMPPGIGAALTRQDEQQANVMRGSFPTRAAAA